MARTKSLNQLRQEIQGQGDQRDQRYAQEKHHQPSWRFYHRFSSFSIYPHADTARGRARPYGVTCQTYPSTITPSPSPSTPRRRGGAGLRAALLQVAATIASPSCVSGASGHFSSTDVACDPTRLQGRAEGRVVPFGLVGVALREVGDHRLEPLALTEVGCDLHAVSGAGMRAGKHPAA